MDVLVDGKRFIEAPPELPADASEIERVLACPIEYENGSKTIKDYLHDLLSTLWKEEEGFSGKRPFGNSGWKASLCYALAIAGIVTAKIDEDGYLNEISESERSRADELIASAIDYIFYSRG